MSIFSQMTTMEPKSESPMVGTSLSDNCSCNECVLEVVNLDAYYNNHIALENISFQLQKGEHVAVVGPNGAGKSTLFKIIAGILKPTTGKLKINGSDRRDHTSIAYIPQRSQVDWAFPVTVSEVVMMARIGKIGLFRRPKAEDKAYVQHCLEIVGMADLAHRQIGELSGGQQQRVFIARAVAQEADLLLMDEPLTGLDVTSQNDILRILENLQERKVSIMVATHDLDLAAKRFNQIMLLRCCLLCFGQAEEVFTSENMLNAYQGHLRFVDTNDSRIMLG